MATALATPEMVLDFKKCRILRLLNEGYPKIADPTGLYDENIIINGNIFHVQCEITEQDVIDLLGK
jgi:hypothetical protein